MPKNRYITLRRAKEVSQISKETLELLVKKKILDTQKKQGKILIKRGISPLSIDEISGLKQYLKYTEGVKRTEFYYFKDKLGDGEKINVRTTIDDLPVFLHRFDGYKEILITNRPISEFPIIDLMEKRGRKKKLTKEQILEAYVFRYFEGMKIKELVDIYNVTDPTIRSKLNKYETQRKRLIEPYFKEIIKRYKLPKNAKLLTVREAAARLNLSNVEIMNLVKNVDLGGYKTKRGKISSFYAIEYKQIKKLIGKEFLKEKLLKGSEFCIQMGWNLEHGWSKIKKFGIHYIPIIPIEEDGLKNTQLHRYHRLSRIPESQLEVARQHLKDIQN